MVIDGSEILQVNLIALIDDFRGHIHGCIPPLIKLLDDRNTKVRSNATTALAELAKFGE